MADAGTKSWSWRALLPDMSAALTRFPLGVAIAALLTLYMLYDSRSGDAEQRIVEGLGASFAWVVAADLYVESQGRARLTRLLLWLAGVAVIALLFASAWKLWLAPFLLSAAFVLLIGLAGHLARGERNASFWLFNHRLWLGGVIALVGAVLLGSGLSAIVETLNLLFGLALPWRLHNDIWTIALGFVAPVSWLAFAPRSFTEPLSQAHETEFTTRAVASIVKFVLVPLLLVYTAILYAYAVKIALEGSLPKGTLGSLVVGYLLTGAATLLLAYPIRETGGALVRLFWRSWVWLALMPVLLLFLAAYTRIEAYGLTEQRYLFVLVGVWALILALLRIVFPRNFDLRLAPLVLALLLFAASFGPWGAIGLSVRSQKAELVNILAAKGLLVDGRLTVPSANEEATSLLGSEAARARSIEWYLNQNHALVLLKPWFEGYPTDPFASGKSPEAQMGELLVALGLRPDVPNGPSPSYFTHYSDVPQPMGLAGYSELIGPVVFEGGGPVPAPIPPQSVQVEGLGAVHLDVDANVITARTEDGAEIKFNLLDAAREIMRRGWPLTQDHTPVRINGTGHGLVGTALIDNLNGEYQEPNFKLTLVRFWFVLGKAP